jgi:hypothetical protein
MRIRKIDIERERRKKIIRTIYLGQADIIYFRFLDKFNKFKSRAGSVTIHVKSSPVSRRLYGDVVIRFLQKHGIPFQVSYARKNFLRRITVLDIPKLKNIISPDREEKVILELYNIIKELLNEYSAEGLFYREKRKAQAKQETS